METTSNEEKKMVAREGLLPASCCLGRVEFCLRACSVSQPHPALCHPLDRGLQAPLSLNTVLAEPRSPLTSLSTPLFLASSAARVPRVCPEVLSQRAILGALPQVLRLLSVWAPTAGWAPVPTPAPACRPPEFSSPLLVEIGAPPEEPMVPPYALSAGFVETCSGSVVSWAWWTHFKSYIRFSTWTKPPPVPRFQFLEEGINPSLSNTVSRE